LAQMAIVYIWAVFIKITAVAQNLAYFFLSICSYFNEILVGYILGDFFHNLIRPPWPKAKTRYKLKTFFEASKPHFFGRSPFKIINEAISLASRNSERPSAAYVHTYTRRHRRKKTVKKN
jgi:hypothetical protein